MLEPADKDAWKERSSQRRNAKATTPGEGNRVTGIVDPRQLGHINVASVALAAIVWALAF